LEHLSDASFLSKLLVLPANVRLDWKVFDRCKHSSQGILKKYHFTIDLLFDWFGIVCFANKNKHCQLPYSRFQTSQTGGQLYSPRRQQQRKKVL
jgi:hypothetical protein